MLYYYIMDINKVLTDLTVKIQLLNKKKRGIYNQKKKYKEIDKREQPGWIEIERTREKEEERKKENLKEEQAKQKQKARHQKYQAMKQSRDANYYQRPGPSIGGQHKWGGSGEIKKLENEIKKIRK